MKPQKPGTTRLFGYCQNAIWINCCGKFSQLLFSRSKLKHMPQESIPVGIVPSAAVAVGGVSAWRCLPGDVCVQVGVCQGRRGVFAQELVSSEGVSAEGVCLHRGCLLRVSVSLRQTSPALVDRILCTRL